MAWEQRKLREHARLFLAEHAAGQLSGKGAVFHLAGTGEKNEEGCSDWGEEQGGHEGPRA